MSTDGNDDEPKRHAQNAEKAIKRNDRNNKREAYQHHQGGVEGYTGNACGENSDTVIDRHCRWGGGLLGVEFL